MSRVVLIVGGTRGIGQRLAALLEAAGDRVIATGREADVSTVDGVGQLLDGCERIDALVVCAAERGPSAPLVDLEVAAWDRVVATNLTGAFLCCREALRRQPSARIALFSSWAAERAEPRSGAYAATKRAVEGLVDALAEEHPGAVVFGVRPAGGGEGAEQLVAAALNAPATAVHGRIISSHRSVDVALTPDAGSMATHSSLDWEAGPVWGVSPRVREALARLASAPSYDYPEVAARRLREAIARHHGVAIQRVVLGAGATELTDRILRVLLRPGDSALLGEPGWIGLAPLLARNRVRECPVPYRIDLDAHRACLDPNELAAAADSRTRAALLSSPHNPLGPALAPAELDAIVATLPPSVLVILDETYQGFAAGVADATSHPANAGGRLIAVRSFSKLDGLAGLRVGYAIAAAHLAERLEAAALPHSVNQAGCVAAREALSDAAFRDQTRRRNARERERLVDLLPEGVGWVRSDANFVAISRGGGPLRAVPIRRPEENDRLLESLNE